MKINKLCKKIGINQVDNNHEIYNITDNTLEVIDNSIFVAIKGYKIDGHNLIDEAINNGAKTIILESKINEKQNINYIYTDNSKKMLAIFLKEYYSHIFNKIKIIGVTGTNGKTTTSTLIHKYLEYSNVKSLLIGSNGAYSSNFFKAHSNTTPRIVDLYGYFNYAYLNNIKYVVMEVSSISISEMRVFDIPFDTLIFTNLHEDHLDYHKNRDIYFYTKMIPFFKLNSNQYAIINLDDEKSKEIMKYLNSKILKYSIKNNSDYKANNIKSSIEGIEFDLNNHKVKSNLIGGFNVYNILPLFAFANIYNLNQYNIILFLRNYKQVDGRMNLLNYKNNNILIDYAHTEAATYNAIIEALKITKNKLYVIIGCGGNRQKDKRYKIGKILNDLNCNVILTSDNPRYENPLDIINDIKSTITKEVLIKEDRREAIIYGLSLLTEFDTLLILGKGVENYIEIKGSLMKSSDIEIIDELIRQNNE